MTLENTNHGKTKNIGHGGFVTGSYKKTVALNEHEVEVYSMPKSFFETKLEDKSSKNTGILILVIGSVLLIGGFVFAYFFFFKNDTTIQINQSNNVVPVSGAKDNTTVDSPQVNDVPEENENLKTEPEPVEQDNNDNSDDNSIEEENTTKVEDDEVEDENTIALNVPTDPDDEDQTDETSITSEDPVAEPEIIVPKVYTKSKDSDFDGLTDVEEMLFSTKETEKDSDGDGYDDLAELNSGYNPAGTGELVVNANIEIYDNQSFNYNIIYPYHWDISDIGDDSSVIFKAPNEQFIQIIVEENTKKQSIEEWYMERYDVSFIKSTQHLYKTGWLGIESEDGLTVCLYNPKSNNIFTITYNTGVGTDLYYPNIFDLMVKSLEQK